MTYPNTTTASDVWSLRDVYKAEAGDEWPSPPVPVPALLTYTMSQSSVYSSNTAATYANMTDDNYVNTDATGTDSEANAFIRCDLGSVKTVTEIRIAPAHAGLAGGWTNSYTENETVRYSDDATNWTVAYTLPSVMTDNQLDVTQVNFTARYVEVWAGTGADFLALCEFQVIGY